MPSRALSIVHYHAAGSPPAPHSPHSTRSYPHGAESSDYSRLCTGIVGSTVARNRCLFDISQGKQVTVRSDIIVEPIEYFPQPPNRTSESAPAVSAVPRNRHAQTMASTEGKAYHDATAQAINKLESMVSAKGAYVVRGSADRRTWRMFLGT